MNLKNKQKAYYSLIFGLVALLMVSQGIRTQFSNPERIQNYSYFLPESADIYISQIEIDDLSANNWTWAKSMGYCIGSGTQLDPFVIGNDTFAYTSGDGLVIKNSIKFFTVINCTFKDSPSAGFLLNNVTNGLLINNSAFDNNHGMRIYKSWDINVTECVFKRNDQYNLNLEQSDNIMMVLNEFIGEDISDTGIRLSYSDNNLMVNNTFSKLFYGPIGLEYSNDNDIIENNCTSPILQGNGVNVFVSHSNYISKNVMINCLRGVSLANSDYNIVSDNLIKDSDQGGVETTNSEHNTIVNNILNNAGDLYIGVSSHFNQILNNNITNNIWEGISIVNSDDNIVKYNFLSDNTQGIRVYFGSERNTLSGNMIRNSIGKSFRIYSNCHFNYVFNNTFVGNGLPAEDNSTNNFWDNGVIGNSWDIYNGTDLDDDGIGDTPHNITGTAGSQDRYPIYSDGDDLGPQIIINSPSGGTVFGEDAPTFNLDIYDINLESFWYTIDNSPIKNYGTVTNGVNLISISASIWDSLPDGNHVFRFFANDTIGHETNVEITISKDAIIDPEPGIPGFNFVIVIGTVLAFIGISVYKIKKKKILNFF